MEIKSLITEDILKRFTVRPRSTLFEKSAKEKAELLKDKRCIVCMNKLRLDRMGNGRCVSKKNKCKVFIRAEVLKKYVDK